MSVKKDQKNPVCQKQDQKNPVSQKQKTKLPVSPKNKKHPVSYNNKKEEKKTSCQSLFVTDRKLPSSFFFCF